MDRELRILSGLHRGALLPLKPGEKLTIGSDPGCDVVLVDQGIASLAMSVQLAAQEWEIERFNASGHLTDTQRLPIGEAILLGGVVLTVAASSEAWVFLSAEEAQRLSSVSNGDLKSDHAPQGVNSTEPSWAKKKSPQPPKVKRKLTQKLLVMGAIMLGFATFSISRTVSTAEADRTDAAARKEAGRTTNKDRLLWDDQVALAHPGGSGSQSQPKTTGPSSSSTPTEHSPERLRSMMIQRLRDAYLADKLELDLTDTAWNMRGVLDEEDSRLFGRILASFYKEHQVKIPLHAYVNSAEEMLPFKIQQFSGGAMGSVVTSDGQRLYVGDAHKGYTLQRIDGRRIVFAGKRKVEVIW